MKFISVVILLLIVSLIAISVYTNNNQTDDKAYHITRISNITANPELYENKTVIVRGAGRPTYSSNIMTSIRMNEGECAMPCADSFSDGSSGMCLKAKTDFFNKNVTMAATVQKEFSQQCNKATWYLYEDRILQDI